MGEGLEDSLLWPMLYPNSSLLSFSLPFSQICRHKLSFFAFSQFGSGFSSASCCACLPCLPYLWNAGMWHFAQILHSARQKFTIVRNLWQSHAEIVLPSLFLKWLTLSVLINAGLSKTMRAWKLCLQHNETSSLGSPYSGRKCLLGLFVILLSLSFKHNFIKLFPLTTERLTEIYKDAPTLFFLLP